MRRALPNFFCVLTLLVLAGCGGYSSEEAKTKCDLARQAQATCFDDATYNACLSCLEECGQDCVLAESCPLQYTCP